MTPNELDGLELAFHRESRRPDAPSFQVKVMPTGFLVNVHRDGRTVCYLGGSIMPNTGTVVPWLVDAQNRKAQLPVVEHERMRDLVRRMIMAIPAARELIQLGEGVPEKVAAHRAAGVEYLRRHGLECSCAECEGPEDEPLLCPGCRRPFTGETTLVGFVNGIDENRATCGCGWSGRFSELVPAEGGACELCGEGTAFLGGLHGKPRWLCAAHQSVGDSPTVH